MPRMELSNPNPIIKDVVLVGGGHTHVHVVKALGMRPIPGVAVTLIAKYVLTPYSGMLPGYVAGHYTLDQLHIDLYKLCQFAGATLIDASCVGLDTDARTVTCDDGRPPVRYDVCSIDIGSTPKLPLGLDLNTVFKGNEGLTPIKPIDNFNERWTNILQRIENKNWEVEGNLKIVVVGGGAGGVEMCLAIQHRLRKVKGVSMVLVSKAHEVVLGCTRQTRTFFKKVLRERGVELKVGRAALGVKRNDDGNRVLLLEDGIEVPYNELIWCTCSSAHEWFKTTNLSLTSDGYIEVDDFIQSTNTPGVFACGDCAVMKNHPRPKAGVFAVRQGPPLVKNIRLMLKGRPLARYHPQKRFLGLISTGDKYAIVSKVGIPALRGKWVWVWKDHIDVKFMKKFQDLPDMSSKSKIDIPISAVVAGPEAIGIIEHASMRCGGCGSKIGSDILTPALRRLGLQTESGPEDAAILPITAGEGFSVVQSVDYFRTCLKDPFLLGRIAMVHALSDIYAMGATPICASVTVVIPYAGKAQVEQNLLQIMSGVKTSLDEAGCLLAAGHTAEGAEMAVGLTPTGVVRTAEILPKGGMKPEDYLILTKAIGSGVIFAASMRGKAHARWIQDAYKVLISTNAPASKVFVNTGANAVTDVTGFGLVGHLLEMIEATGNKTGDDQCSCDGNGVERSCDGGIKVEIDISSVPVLQGALECFRLGVESTLQSSNMKVGKYVECDGLERSDPLHSVLYDPQTSGGLLASVHALQVQSCLDALPGAVVIGKVVHASAWDGPSLIKVKKKPPQP